MWIGRTEFTEPQAKAVVEKMRQRLAREFGVTVVGSCVTLRFYEKKNGPLIQVSMVISDVDNGEEEEFEDK